MQCNPNLISCCSAIYEGSALPKIVKLNCVTSLCTAGQPYALQTTGKGSSLLQKWVKVPWNNSERDKNVSHRTISPYSKRQRSPHCHQLWAQTESLVPSKYFNRGKDLKVTNVTFTVTIAFTALVTTWGNLLHTKPLSSLIFQVQPSLLFSVLHFIIFPSFSIL